MTLTCRTPITVEEFPEGLDVRVVAPQALDYRLDCARWLAGAGLAAGTTCVGTNVEVVLVSLLVDAVVVQVRPVPDAVPGDRAELVFRVVDTDGHETWATRLVRYVRA